MLHATGAKSTEVNSVITLKYHQWSVGQQIVVQRDFQKP